MHHDRVGLGECEPLGCEAVGLGEFLRTGQQRAAHALVLQAQSHDHVAAANAFIHVMAHPHAELVHAGGHQCLGADHANFRRAERGERMDQRARHARMQDVADDRHGQLAEVLLVVPDGVEVEQALRRMRMPAVARVDHMRAGADVFCDQVRRARLRMAHHEHVRVHRREIVDRVEQGFALGRGRGRDVEVDHVRRQALGGDFEGGAGAGRVLEEQVEHALAAKQRHLLYLAFGDADEGLRCVEDLEDHLARQALDGEQVLELAVFVELGIDHGVAGFRSRRASDSFRLKRSASSRSSTRICPSGTLRWAPQYCAAIGNSRPPRSTSTASSIFAGRP